MYNKNVNLFVYSLVITFFFACESKSPEHYLTKAKKIEEEGRFEDANSLLSKAIEIDSTFLGAYINRGVNKASMGLFEEAIKDYEKVLKLDSNNTLALFNIGNNYKRLEKYDFAVIYYNKAFESKGGENVYLDINQNNLFSIGEFDVNGYEIHYERGIAFYYIGNLSKSFADFEASISSNYMIAECFYWVGYIYISEKQIDLACEFFTKSMQLGNTDAETALDKYCNYDVQ